MLATHVSTAGLTFAIFVAACPRAIPAHLQVGDAAAPKTAAMVGEIEDLEHAVSWLIDGDALARTARFPDPSALIGIEGADGIGEFIGAVQDGEQRQGNLVPVLQRFTVAHPGTAVTPLSRGYRLRRAEDQLAGWQGTTTDPALRSLAPWLAPLVQDDNPGGTVRHPLEFLDEGLGFSESVRRYGERWVATGWLDGPELPLGPIAKALAQPQFDPLRSSPVGALLVSRASGATADIAAGWDDLRLATDFALQRAAANRNSEQRAWAARRDEARERLGQDKPIAYLLQRAATRLTAAAGSDQAAGGALVALTASRYHGDCPWAPCTGLDRVQTLQAADRWGTDVAAVASTWRVIAWTEAIDSMEVGRDTVVFPKALINLADAILGIGSAPLPASLTSHRVASEEVWHELGRALGRTEVRDWEALKVALQQQLTIQATESLSLNQNTPLAPHLRRILERARP